MVAIAAVLSFFVLSCQNDTQSVGNNEQQPVDLAKNPVERGKYLVEIMGCNDCHSPKRMGEKGPEIIPELMLSGYPADRPVVEFDTTMTNKGFGIFYPDLTGAAGPWGISFAANLTPDDSGIGSWSKEQFKKALTQGKFKGLDNSRMLLPPMPWINYINIEDEDIYAMFAYLKSIPAVKNVVPAPIPPGDI